MHKSKTPTQEKFKYTNSKVHLVIYMMRNKAQHRLLHKNNDTAVAKQKNLISFFFEFITIDMI